MYEIPYHTLVNKTFTNIFAAGRPISAAGDVWEAVRVIPLAVLTVQTAGPAAAMAMKKKCRVAEVPVGELQKELEKADVIIHYNKKS